MTYKFVVNIATPESLEELQLVRDFVEDPKRRETVGVNGAYSGVVAHMTAESHWHRPGFDFKFWFEDAAVAEEFRTVVSAFSNSTIEAL